VSALAARPEPRQEASTSALEAVGVSKRFGGVEALRGVSLRLPVGAVFGLIGPNGSGKTTLLNCLSGVLTPTSGSIRLDGASIEGHPANRLARAGIVRTFQNIRLFGKLTARQNVETSALAAGRVPRRRSRERSLELLAELGIAHVADRDAGTLSYGDQRRVEIARALAAGPRFLLLDEPAAGMNEAESDELRASIDRIRSDRGSGVLVVEHDLRLIMQLCETIYVLNEGTLIAQGTPRDVRSDPAVVAAYIGQESEERS
jgi:ABC-type branched-subunit amino acid transport system ATPase component